MDDIEKALAEGVWAIAFTPSGKYIGQLCPVVGEQASTKSYFVEHLTNPIRIRYAQEYHASLMPRPMLDEHGQQVMGLARRLEAFCISRCLDVEKTQIYVTPTDLLFFEDMAIGDRNWHQNLVRNGIRAALQQRAADSNIILPGMEQHPGHA